MAKTPKRHNQNWSSREVKQLKQLVKENTPTLVIGLKLERSKASIYGMPDARRMAAPVPTSSLVVAIGAAAPRCGSCWKQAWSERLHADVRA